MYEYEFNGKVMIPTPIGEIDLNSLNGVNVKTFGAIGNGLNDDTTPIQKAINKAVETGGVVLFPNGKYLVKETLTVGSNITINIPTGTTIISTILNKDLFKINGDNVLICGGGSIECPEMWDGANEEWLYSVIHIFGDNCTVRDINIKNIQKVGIGVEGSNTFITNNRLIGNYPSIQFTGVETAHFGVAISPKGTNIEGANISNNVIELCVQAVFVGTYGGGQTYGFNVSSNKLQNCYDHGVYANGGLGNIISDNNFFDCKGAVASYGKHALISSNNIFNPNTGGVFDKVSISVREASHCIVKGNIIKGEGLTSGTVIDLVNLSGDPLPNTILDNNIVEGNIIDIPLGNVQAIRVGTTAQTEESYNNIIKNNIINANGVTGLIVLLVKTTGIGRNNHVIGNQINVINNVTAIYPYRQTQMVISNNSITFRYSAVSGETITLVNCLTVNKSIFSNNLIMCDSDYGTNVTLRGYREDTNSNYNLVIGNNIYLDPTLLTGKTELFLNSTSKSVSNMIAGLFVA